jgi:PAS domain-containing protein
VRVENSECKQAEEAKGAEDKARLIINTVPAFIWTAGADGRIDFIGQRWVDYVGMTLDQILAQRMGSHCHR